MRKRTAVVTSVGLVILALVGCALIVLKGRIDARDTGGEKRAETRARLERIAKASEAYFERLSEWVGSFSQLAQRELRLTDRKLPPHDAWGNPVRYEPFNKSLGYGRVISYGQDGEKGGEGAAADIEVRFGPPDGLAGLVGAGVETVRDFTQGGIGVLLTVDADSGLPKVVTFTKHSPAKAAGVQTRDLIYAVNGKSLEGKSLKEAVDLITGFAGMSVTLEVRRHDSPTNRTIKIRRTHWNRIKP